MVSGWSPYLLVVSLGTSSAHILAVSWIQKSAHVASISIWRLSKLRMWRRQLRPTKASIAFLIQHNATLVLPAPASAQHQMSETQVEHTARIANERIFVEHAVKAVKRFKWLQRRVPLIQVDLIDPVLTVAALMANFTHRPFVKKEVRALYPTDPCAYQLVYDRKLPFEPLPKVASSLE